MEILLCDATFIFNMRCDADVGRLCHGTDAPTGYWRRSGMAFEENSILYEIKNGFIQIQEMIRCNGMRGTYRNVDGQNRAGIGNGTVSLYHEIHLAWGCRAFRCLFKLDD